ncbi:hypothetical protein V1514DRAFT_310811 [Lipomyces japonicus]|uniref:uncharacterized protein n=1 Tax=Lipomyces japonicus TaxID=56871 RepID=UPI0034D01D7E
MPTKNDEDGPDKKEALAFTQIQSVCKSLLAKSLWLGMSSDGDAGENKRIITEELVKMHRALCGISADAFNARLVDYVYYPFTYLLMHRTRLDDRQIELVILSTEICIRQCWSKNMKFELAKELLVLLTHLVGGEPISKDQEPFQRTISDETKKAGCIALLQLFKGINNSKSCLAMFKQGNNLLAISHTVTVLLDVISKSNDIYTQNAAIIALEFLLYNVINDGEVLASFLPGCVSSLCNTIAPRTNKKVQFRIVQNCISLLAGYLVRTLSDVQLAGILIKHENDDVTISNDCNGQERKKIRTLAWLNLTKSKVKLAVEVVVKFANHSRPEPRLAVTKFCTSLCMRSFNCLENCRSLLIDTILYMLDDADDEVKGIARKYWDLYGVLNKDAGLVVKQCLYDRINSLQSTLAIKDEDKKWRSFSKINSTIELLARSTNDFSIIGDMLLSSVQSSITLNMHQSAVMSLASSSSANAVILSQGVNKIFDSFPPLKINDVAGDKATKQLQLVFYTIGSSNFGPEFFESCFLAASDPLMSLKMQQVTLWMIVHVGHGLITREEYQNLNGKEADIFIDRVFDLSNGVILKYVDNDKLSDEEITLLMVAIEALAVLYLMNDPMSLGEFELMYPVLNLVASRIPVLQNHAMILLNLAAQVNEYSDIANMLVSEIDYVLDDISISLNTIQISPRTSKVLTTMIKLAGEKAIPYLDDLVAEIFIILDNYHGYQGLVEGFIETLKTVVEETATAYMGTQLSIQDRRNRPGIWSLEQLIDELIRKPQVTVTEKLDGADKDGTFETAAKSENNDNDSDNDTQPRNEYEGKKEDVKWDSVVPKKWYDINKRIALLAQYYLTHSSLTLRFQLLDLLHIAAPILATSSTELLPVINDVWPEVIGRLQDPETHVITSALIVIADFSTYAGDFMASRIEKAWPAIKSHVPMQVPREREGKFSRPALLLAAVMKCVTAVVQHTRIREPVFYDMLRTCQPYLHLYPNLKQAFEFVSEDAVWLYLNYY